MMIKTDVIKEKCVLCGGCVAVCRNNAITLTEDDLEIEEERCTGCKICIIFCPMDAMNELRIAN
jgi:pyruvate formate lyase activating enzyme